MLKKQNINAPDCELTLYGLSYKPHEGAFYFYTMKEIWKDVKWYEGMYQISNYGKVKGLERYVHHWTGSQKKLKEKQIKECIGKNGYIGVWLCNNGIKKRYNVHVLMAMSFLNHIPNKYKIVVDHINNIKTDNTLSNLQLITHRQNSSKDSTNKSGYLGVFQNSNNWIARIRINNILVNLGTFKTKKEAGIAYNNKLNTLK